MPLRREILQEQAKCELAFLDDRWDPALLGFAECGHNGRCLPCYGYQAAKAHLKEIGVPAQQIFPRLAVLTAGNALILQKISRNVLWNRIRDEGYKCWDSVLDAAILGIGTVRWETSGVIYSRPAVMDILVKTQKLAPGAGVPDAAVAEAIVDGELAPADLGAKSPWLLTPIKTEQA